MNPPVASSLAPSQQVLMFPKNPPPNDPKKDTEMKKK
jgi:hypothetical protein